MNDIAAFLTGKTPLVDWEESLQRFAGDPEAREILFMASCPGIRESLATDLPYSLHADFVAGIDKGYFCILHDDGICRESRQGRLWDALFRISGRRLPLCLNRLVHLDIDLFPLSTPVEVVLSAVEDATELSVGIKENAAGHIEVWKDGVLIRAVPAGQTPQRRVSVLEPNTHYAIRHSKSASGVSIVLSEIEFGYREWISASLCSAVAGNPSEAARILVSQSSGRFADRAKIRRAVARIQAVGAVAGSNGSILVPRPVVRSRQVADEDRVAVFGLVWEGIVNYWPDAAKRKNPWEDVLPPLKKEGAPLHDEACELIRATIAAAEGSFDPRESRPHSTDLVVQSGWAALRGWSRILDRDFQGGLESFVSVPRPEEDPFGLKHAEYLARQLMTALQQRDSVHEPNLSDEVWRESFSGLLP